MVIDACGIVRLIVEQHRPEWNLRDIYIGMMQLMVIQLISLILILTFPQIALWLPEQIYGK
jgi:TRAP-type mannitol/chloroaromatic compound transport system permease large subunit